MGSGTDLPSAVQKDLVEGLLQHATTLIFLAYVDSRPAGLATCFLGFSTFAARPLINIHDLHVLEEFQRNGIGRRLLEAVESRARQLNCCKLTLEVQVNNRVARRLYQDFGFMGAVHEEDAGSALFREKKLE